MVLALPVLHPDKPDHLLLKPGVRLDADMIAKLREMKVPRLWIGYPPTNFLLRSASPAIIAEHGRLASRLGEAFDAVTSNCHADFDFHVFAESVRSLIQRLLDDPHAAVFMEGLLETRQPLLTHSANVCMISLLMGLKLDGYLIAERRAISARRAQNIENLGVGALLHDLGMLTIDPAAASRWYATFDESDIAWRRHTIAGFEMVRGKIAATAAAVLLHHHQRQDGSGFPRRQRAWTPPRALSGPEIHVFARIVAVADVFDRVRQKAEATGPDAAGERRPVPAVRALGQVVADTRAGRLDSTVLKALLSVVPAYPPGAIVDLNDGRTCVVTGWNPALPCSPTVRPLLPADPRTGEHPLGAEVDLARNAALLIRSIEGECVTDDNFHPLHRGEFDLRLPGSGFALDAPAVEHEVGEAA